MPSIVLDREEEMESQTESVVASVRQDAPLRKGAGRFRRTDVSRREKMVSFRLWRALHAFPVGFRRETGDHRRFPAMQKDLGLSDSQVASPVPPYC